MKLRYIMKYCEYCKCKVFDHEKVCSQCGAAIKTSEKQPKEETKSVFVYTQQIQKRESERIAPIFLICLFVIPLLIVGIASSTLGKKASKPTNSKENTYLSSSAIAANIEVAFQELGYNAKYKKIGNDTRMMIYINQEHNDFFGSYFFGNFSSSPAYYFYGQLDDLNKAYVFHSENVSDTSKEKTCMFLLQNPTVDELYECNKEDTEQNIKLQKNLENWIEKFEIEDTTKEQISNHLGFWNKYTGNQISFTNSTFKQKQYQISVIDDFSIRIDSPYNSSFSITYDQYGITDTITYSNNEKQLNNEKVYARQADAELSSEAQNSISDEKDFLSLRNYQSLRMYASSYYFENLEKQREQ